MSVIAAKQVNEQASQKDQSVKSVSARTQMLVLAAMKNGVAVTKRFDRNYFEYDANIKCSYMTYWGLVESLKALAEICKQQNINDICVLCPRFAPTKQKNTNHIFFADTQACFGGKRAMKWDQEKNNYVPECFEETFNALLHNKMRIHNLEQPVCLDDVYVKISGKFKHNSAQKKPLDVLTTLTQILAIKASDCRGISKEELENSTSENSTSENSTSENSSDKTSDKTSNKSKKNQRGRNINPHRVGCVVWGTFEECVHLVNSIPLDNSETKKSEFSGAIEAVSIVSLSKAIEMAEYATKYLKLTRKIKSF